MIRPLHSSSDIGSIEALPQHLGATYEGPDEKGTAKRELCILRQGSSDFTSHYARFQSTLAVLGWDGSRTQRFTSPCPRNTRRPWHGPSSPERVHRRVRRQGQAARRPTASLHGRIQDQKATSNETRPPTPAHSESANV